MTETPTGPVSQGTVRKRLAWFATGWKGWDYEDGLQAIIAASNAGWDDDRIYREVFRLLLDPDGCPNDLRVAVRRPGEAAGRNPTYGDERNRAVVANLQRARERSDEAAARIQAQARGTSRPARDEPDDAA